MSILSVDNISPIGSGTSVTINSAATLVLTNANSTGVITATSFVGNLTGTASQVTIANGADNRVLTAASANTINGESGFTFNGSLASIINSSGPTLELTTNTNAADASLRLHEGTTGSTTNGGGMFYSGADNKLHITCGTNLTTKRITITRDAGLIGIATDAPSSAFLDIASSQATDSLRMRRLSSDSNVASNWSMKPYGGHLYFREGGSTDKIQFMNGGDLYILDGNLRVASGHGIDFAATSDASGNTSELLDDYEEGTYTPVLTYDSSDSGNKSYQTRHGTYTKIGRVVTANFYVELNNKGTGNGAVAISLPYQVASLLSGTSLEAGGVIHYFTGLVNSWSDITISALDGLSRCRMYGIGGNYAAASAAFEYSAMANTFNIRGSITYQAA